MTEKNRRFWIGVASKNHVANGVNLGICQFCHGKSTPAKRLKKNDFIIYYSPKQTMEGSEPCQQFTALGIVIDNSPYQVTINENFRPFRRNVTYFDAQHIDIKPLISILPFIKNKQSWGYIFRYGFFEIDQESFEIIAQKMLNFNPLKSF
jgi:predicted RNA-binding protein